MFIPTRHLSGFMPNLHKKSWMSSNAECAHIGWWWLKTPLAYTTFHYFKTIHHTFNLLSSPGFLILSTSHVAIAFSFLNLNSVHLPTMGWIHFFEGNGILLPKLFWPTVKKECSVIEKNFWNSRNILWKQ